MMTTICKAAPTGNTRMQAEITKAGTPGYDNSLGPREIRVLASTAAIDLMNEKVMPLGMTPATTDVPVYYNHASASPDTLPIGRAVLRATAKGVIGTIVFAPEGDDPFADRVCKACKSGLLDSVSIGFTPKKVSRSKDGKNLVYETWMCNELSVVGIGANPEARITQRALNTDNPDRDARMARAEILRAKGERMARATEHHIKGLALQREVSRAEAIAAPSHLDNMTPAERRQYAREVAARGNSSPTPTSNLPAAEVEAQKNALHAAAVAAHSMAAYPDRASRILIAAKAARGPRS